jgi:TonB family protein
MATFAEPRMLLAQRIRRIAQWPPERRPAAAIASALGAVLLFGAALSCADPVRIADATREPRDLVGLPEPARGDAATDSTRPVFTPMTAAPQLLNRADIEKALIDHYPPLLRDAGIGGAPTVHLFINEDGAVRRTLISRSSGYAALDTAALHVARKMSFEPAQNRDRIVPVWVEIPIVFKGATKPASRSDAMDDVPAGEIPARPLGVPSEGEKGEYDRGPELLNRAETERVLIRSYPPLLRDAGIGGTATVHFFIDETGTVQRRELGRRTGYPALDEAALAVARTMELSPARKAGRAVSAWVEIPIVFTAK